MAWSKFTPDEAPLDPLASTEAAQRRAWLLKWGVWVSQAMLYLGFLVILYYGFLREGPVGDWVRANWPF